MGGGEGGGAPCNGLYKRLCLKGVYKRVIEFHKIRHKRGLEI